MNKQKLTALAKSIQHWTENVNVTRWENASIGPINCALCDLYFHHYCIGCPVKKSTGHKICYGTPYEAVEPLWIRHRDGFRSSLKDFRAAALEELNFLKALWPAGYGN